MFIFYIEAVLLVHQMFFCRTKFTNLFILILHVFIIHLKFSSRFVKVGRWVSDLSLKVEKVVEGWIDNCRITLLSLTVMSLVSCTSD